MTQLTDVAPERAEPRLTDSQKFMRDEEEKLIEFVREQKEQKKKAEEKAKKDKLPAFELQDRQRAADLMLSPDDTHVFIARRRTARRREERDRPELRDRDRLHRGHPRRAPNVGDTQDRRLLAILNLKTGKTAWADGSFAPPRDPRRSRRPRGTAAPGGRPAAKARARDPLVMPVVSDDGKLRRRRGARRPTTRIAGSSTLDPETGKTKVIDTLHDDAWVREAGAGSADRGRRVPARQQARVVPVGARRLDAPLHARRRRLTARSRGS